MIERGQLGPVDDLVSFSPQIVGALIIIHFDFGLGDGFVIGTLEDTVGGGLLLSLIARSPTGILVLGGEVGV